MALSFMPRNSLVTRLQQCRNKWTWLLPTRGWFQPDARTLPRMKFGFLVSGNFFRVLGVRRPLGRDFRPDEDSGPGAQCRGDARPRFLGEPVWRQPVGSRLADRLNGIEFTVIGVAPE